MKNVLTEIIDYSVWTLSLTVSDGVIDWRPEKRVVQVTSARPVVFFTGGATHLGNSVMNIPHTRHPKYF